MTKPITIAAIIGAFVLGSVSSISLVEGANPATDSIVSAIDRLTATVSNISSVAGPPGPEGPQGPPGPPTTSMIFSFSDGFDNYDGSGFAVLGHGELSISTTDMVAYDGIMKNLYVHVPGSISPGENFSVTLQIGQLGSNSVINTALTCSITPGENSCTNLTDEVPMDAGQHFRLLIKGDGAPGIINAAMEYTSP